LERAAQLQREGHTVVFVAVDGDLGGLIALRDKIKPDSAYVVRELKAMGTLADATIPSHPI